MKKLKRKSKAPRRHKKYKNGKRPAGSIRIEIEPVIVAKRRLSKKELRNSLENIGKRSQTEGLLNLFARN
jgi:hypothetical protein